MRMISAAETVDALSIAEAAEVIAQTYKALGNGEVEPSTPSAMRVAGPPHRIQLKGAILQARRHRRRAAQLARPSAADAVGSRKRRADPVSGRELALRVPHRRVRRGGRAMADAAPESADRADRRGRDRNAYGTRVRRIMHAGGHHGRVAHARIRRAACRQCAQHQRRGRGVRSRQRCAAPTSSRPSPRPRRGSCSRTGSSRAPPCCRWAAGRNSTSASGTARASLRRRSRLCAVSGRPRRLG